MLTASLGPHAALAAISVPNKRAYADRHGYRLKAITSTEEMHLPHFQKMVQALRLFESGQCAWVFWSDADAVVQRMDLRLDDYVLGESADLIFSWDDEERYAPHSCGRAQQDRQYHQVRPVALERRADAAPSDGAAAGTGAQLNSGHFFVKNSTYGRDFLRFAQTLTRRTHYTYWSDQGAFAEALYLRRNEIAPHVRFYSMRAFNSRFHLTLPPEMRKGLANDFILHMPGSARAAKPANESLDEMRGLLRFVLDHHAEAHASYAPALLA